MQCEHARQRVQLAVESPRYGRVELSGYYGSDGEKRVDGGWKRTSYLLEDLGGVGHRESGSVTVAGFYAPVTR